MNTQVTVIVNASSGMHEGDDFARGLGNRFKSLGIDADVRLTRSTEIVVEVQRALADNPKMIVLGGGDGTLNTGASMLIGTNVALGILPLGTLNHFAKDLGIPLHPDDAIQNIANGYIRMVDVGAVSDRFFLNNCSLGLYAEAVKGREALQQRLGRGKWLALMAATVSVFRRYPLLDVRIDAEGADLARRTPFVFIGNNRYDMEGFSIGTRKCLDGATLSLYVANRTGRLGLFRLAARSLFKRLHQAKDFDMVSAKTIQVATRHKQLLVAIDGELCHMRSPLNYQLLPAALAVIVPGPEATRKD